MTARIHAVHAPKPPKRFRGEFVRTRSGRDRWSRASGPVRILPAAVARPVDTEDVSELVSWAAAEGAFLIPRGAGTGMPGGNVGPGVVVDLSAWDHLGEIDVGERTVRAGPGVTGARLDGAARSTGLFVPALPSSAERCTVGGMIANNAAGARSFRYGSIRPWVEALGVVMADGVPLTVRRGGPPPAPPSPFSALHRSLLDLLGSTPGGWPSVRKNSSGYALDRYLPSADPVDLLVGSEGTLGIVTDVQIRLVPEPGDRALVLLSLPTLDALPDAVALADSADASACEFFAASFLDVAGLREDPAVGSLASGAEALLLVELAGTVSRIADGIRAFRTFAGGLGAALAEARASADRERLWAIRHAASPHIASRAQEGLVSIQFIEDSVLPPGHLVTYLRSLDAILKREDTRAVMFGHAGDGNVHVNPLIDVGRRGWRERVRRILEATVDLVAELGGTLSGEHGDGRIRAPYLERIWGARLGDAFRRVKSSLDPQGVLNPGVILPLPEQDPLQGLEPHRPEPLGTRS